MAVLVLHQALGLGFGVLCPRTESFVKCEAFFTNQSLWVHGDRVVAGAEDYRDQAQTTLIH